MNWILLTQMALSTALILSCARTDRTDNNESEFSSFQAENLIVHSDDGTGIGYTKAGSGPIPLVIVHGAINSGEHWMLVAKEMEEHLTVYVMDRWGRGGSEHRTDYAFEREAEDIQAVLAEAGPSAYLLGHSSGAIYALEAARDTPIAGLILYEPPLHSHGSGFESILERIRVAANEERFDDAMYIFLRDEARIPEEELSFLQETPDWEIMVELMPQSVQEWTALVDVSPTVERYKDITVPTLLLTGTETENHPSFATHTLETLLPDARIAILEGQGHGSHRGAPDLLAKEVTYFILETSR